ncbi:hypothetical protein Tco_0842224 [Tanacetum coccineum]|uniref:Uncharacterized protein n=1 Tax=Tanacetum coccineum TaxID=301880 RepID=A0ABQ5B1D5_9ASTR
MEEDWDAIRAKLKLMQDLTECARKRVARRRLCQRRMVELVYREEVLCRRRAKQEDWSQHVESFIPINIEATKGTVEKIWRRSSRQRFQEQRIDDKDVGLYGKYGTNRPEDAYDRVLWSDLRTMFDPPLNEDAIWSLPLQQKIISWRYYDKCEVHCLTLEACSIYMLADRKYPLSKDACQVMLKMKLLDGKMNEVCYKLLKMIEKQAGVRK